MDQSAIQRLEKCEGIAIGPILFVIAILAVLATAIAAGSSTFATSSGQETNRINAAALVQIGQTLKLGADRLVALGTPLANVDINSSNTSAANSLFSPTGGGLVSPSTALANDAASDQWIYTWGVVTSLGTNAPERIAALHVTLGVCDQINSQINMPSPYYGSGGNKQNPMVGSNVGVISNTQNFTSWPSEQIGHMVGCLADSSVDATGYYYFYQILGVQ